MLQPEAQHVPEHSPQWYAGDMVGIESGEIIGIYTQKVATHSSEAKKG